MKVRKYKHKDVLKIDAPPDAYGGLTAEEAHNRLELLFSTSIAYAFSLVDDKDDDKIYAVVGCTRLHDGVFEVWTYLGNDIKKYPKSYTKHLGALLTSLPHVMKVHRIQAHVRRDFPRGIRWLLYFGFKIEGCLTGFCQDGTDAIIMGVSWQNQSQQR